MTEDHPLEAETTYAAGKAAADLALLSYGRMFDLDIRIIRSFNNYGPRQNEGSFAAVVPLTLRRMREGRRPVIEGDGDQTRDFIYVGDTVAAILALADCEDLRNRVANIGSGRETSIAAIIETLMDLVGWEDGVERAPARTADVRRHWADTTFAEKCIGPMATTELRPGLRQTIDSYHEIDRYNKIDRNNREEASRAAHHQA